MQMNYQPGFRRVFAASGSRSGSLFLAALGIALLFSAQGSIRSIAAQTETKTPAPPATAKPPVKKKYTLRITKEGIIGVSLKADRAKFTEITAELSKKLGVKVILGASMEQEAI